MKLWTLIYNILTTYTPDDRPPQEQLVRWSDFIWSTTRPTPESMEAWIRRTTHQTLDHFTYSFSNWTIAPATPEDIEKVNHKYKHICRLEILEPWHPAERMTDENNHETMPLL